MILESKSVPRALILLAFVCTACGGDNGNANRPDFSQDVNDIEYQLKRIDLKMEIFYEDGDVGRINTSLFSEKDLSQEKIRRVTQDGQYFLVVNQENADLTIKPDAGLDTKKERKGEDGCHWRGNIDADGSALYNKLDFTWKMQAAIDGKDCPSSIANEYSEFVTKEIGSLHLRAIQKIRDAGLLDLEGSKEVRIEIKIVGDVH